MSYVLESIPANCPPTTDTHGNDGVPERSFDTNADLVNSCVRCLASLDIVVEMGQAHALSCRLAARRHRSPPLQLHAGLADIILIQLIMNKPCLCLRFEQMRATRTGCCTLCLQQQPVTG